MISGGRAGRGGEGRDRQKRVVRLAVWVVQFSSREGRDVVFVVVEGITIQSRRVSGVLDALLFCPRQASVGQITHKKTCLPNQFLIVDVIGLK